MYLYCYYWSIPSLEYRLHVFWYIAQYWQVLYVYLINACEMIEGLICYTFGFLKVTPFFSSFIEV